MALVRVSPLDRQYDLRFLKCEVCKCEVCSHIEKSQAVKNQRETGMISAAIERPRRDKGSEHTYNWVRATPIAAPSLVPSRRSKCLLRETCGQGWAATPRAATSRNDVPAED